MSIGFLSTSLPPVLPSIWLCLLVKRSRSSSVVLPKSLPSVAWSLLHPVCTWRTRLSISHPATMLRRLLRREGSFVLPMSRRCVRCAQPTLVTEKIEGVSLMDTKVLQAVARYAEEIMGPEGFRYVSAVVANCKMLAVQLEGLEEQAVTLDMDALVVSAYLHDISTVSHGYQDHHLKSAEMAVEF